VSELVIALLWCFHELDNCGGVWDQVTLKMTPHISAWDDPIGQSIVVADSLVVSVVD
jgi:hypothetical protein